MKKLILLLLIPSVLLSQEDITLSIYQDTKLLFIGDDIGNTSLTPNLIFRANLQDFQKKWGYLYVFPEFEYANLKGGEYQRYSMNAGYNFNRLIVNNTEFGLTAGYGWINRNSATSNSFSIGSVISYKISKIIKITALYQLTERSELKTKVLRSSFFAGIELTIKKG